jgi:hypothetical protein
MAAEGRQGFVSIQIVSIQIVSIQIVSIQIVSIQIFFDRLAGCDHARGIAGRGQRD